ncbi:cytochrome P450 [Obba rivulosa]|uniref:Cytochrome P450 n=1 Tax=Obba rivulosa TaxID=1052685 RepID=A0A8E2DHS4_9APHY|nr:cytochrome P450 [Obba rivulosa]
MASSSPLVSVSELVVVCAVCAFAYTFLKRTQTRYASLPPGPPGHWLFGNNITGPYLPRIYEKLCQEYGPVFTVRQGRDVTVVIGRYEAAVEIMGGKSADLADRPRAVAAGEIMSGGYRLLLSSGKDLVRRLRTTMHALTQPRVAATYEPMQMRNAKRYILDVLENPANQLEHARRYAASFIMEVTFGKTTPTSYSDPEVQAIQQLVINLGTALLPGKYLVNSYPILRHIPAFVSKLKRMHVEEKTLYQKQLDIVEEKMAKGEAQPSFGTYLLENRAKLGLSDGQLLYLAGSMFAAGSDTASRPISHLKMPKPLILQTAAALGFVSIAAACYPEAQARVQAQLDEVIGRQRLPTFADRKMLPEVEAFFLEVLRWRPISVLGFAHKATKDVIWRDYVIPAGTTVLGCHWAISRDPDVFPEPEVFNPQRWLDEQGRIKTDTRFQSFGFGRRTCPGQHIAERSLFINCALLLWAFSISQDPSKPIDTYAMVDSIIAHPLPFAANYQRRISNLEELIASHQD